MIDPKSLDRKRLEEFKVIAATQVGQHTGDYKSHLEKTCAFVNLFFACMLEDFDKEFTEKERLAERRKAPGARPDDHLTGRGKYRPFDDR